MGPSGNYLPEFGPYLNAGGTNTWGESPNLDGEDSDEVRAYIVDNVHQWLRDYHVDGLRLDAVHALHDTRATHILEEMAIEAEVLSAFVGRPLHPDRRVRPQRPAPDHLPRGRRLRPRPGSGATTSTTPCTSA